MTRRVGVIGTFVWDVIYGQPPESVRVEDWGGITYALSGLDAALDDDWEFVPIIKVGADRIAAACEFLSTLSHASPNAQLVEVAEKNNCSELRYYSADRRSERLSGGLPAWTWTELQPRIDAARCDALLVNFLSGWELDLTVAQALRQYFRGSMYADLHMMLWKADASGVRTLTPIDQPDAWCACFDYVQVNEDEAATVASSALSLAEMAASNAVKRTYVTLGRSGAQCLEGSPGNLQSTVISAEQIREGSGVDPTGCGDVWGATNFARMLSGDDLVTAMNAANSAAGLNAVSHGTRGLARRLRESR